MCHITGQVNDFLLAINASPRRKTLTTLFCASSVNSMLFIVGANDLNELEIRIVGLSGLNFSPKCMKFWNSNLLTVPYFGSGT